MVACLRGAVRNWSVPPLSRFVETKKRSSGFTNWFLIHPWGQLCSLFISSMTRFAKAATSRSVSMRAEQRPTAVGALVGDLRFLAQLPHISQRMTAKEGKRTRISRLVSTIWPVGTIETGESWISHPQNGGGLPAERRTGLPG
jgi:hypothetical protein